MAKTKAGHPFETLEDKVLFYARFGARKHGHHLNETDYINEMSQYEFLQAISQALAEEDDDDVPI